MDEFNWTDSPEQEALRLFQGGQCPFCGSTQLKVEKTLKPIRKLFCTSCSSRWRSCEVNLIFPDALSRAASLENLKKEIGRAVPFL